MRAQGTGAAAGRPNTWGQHAQESRIAFPQGGRIGRALLRMGSDRHRAVGGRPLADVVGEIATRVTRRVISPQDGLTEYERVLAGLPADGPAYEHLSAAVAAMDAPACPLPVLPAEVLAPLRALLASLHGIPIVRATPEVELQPLLQVVSAWQAGRLSDRRLLTEVANLDRRHESDADCGKFYVDWLIEQSLEDLRRCELTPPVAPSPSAVAALGLTPVEPVRRLAGTEGYATPLGELATRVFPLRCAEVGDWLLAADGSTVYEVTSSQRCQTAVSVALWSVSMDDATAGRLLQEQGGVEAGRDPRAARCEGEPNTPVYHVLRERPA